MYACATTVQARFATGRAVSSIAVAAATGFAALAFAGPASAVVVDQNINIAQCTHQGGDPQSCAQRGALTLTVSENSLATITFTASPHHCSDIQVHLAIGDTTVGGGQVGAGQTVVAQGSVYPGPNSIYVSAYGISGGCNQGELQSWAGTLHAET